MGQELGNYSLGDIQLDLGGLPIDGYSDGDAIKITADEANWSFKQGATGASSRSRNLVSSATVTITVMATSKFNDVLQGLSRLDKMTMRGIFSFHLRDTNGTSEYFGRQAWIENEPDVTFGKEAGTREWVIKVAHMQFNTGGAFEAF